MALTKIRGYTQLLSGGVTNSEIAMPSGVAPDTGIQLSKIQDSNLLLKSDGSIPVVKPLAGVNPTNSNHFATKNYVDSVAQGLDVKASVRIVSTTSITLSGLQTIDGVVLAVGDRVLLTAQSNPQQNGIYVADSGAWQRATDANSSTAVTPGLFTFVEEGTVNATTGWVLASKGTITLDSTPLSFTQFSAAGSVSAGNGLTKVGTSLSILPADSSLSVSGAGINVALDGSTLVTTSAGIKLANLQPGQLLIGSTSNVPTAQTIVGDISINSTGTVRLTDGSVTASKLAPLPAAKFLIGTAAGTNTQVTLSGDVIIDETGLVTINPNTTIKLADTVVREIPSGTIDGSNQIFTLSFTPRAGKESVYVNGILQDPGSSNDYTISGLTITLAYPLIAGDKICVSYFK